MGAKFWLAILLSISGLYAYYEEYIMIFLNSALNLQDAAVDPVDPVLMQTFTTTMTNLTPKTKRVKTSLHILLIGRSLSPKTTLRLR